jgi:hypothetical protein
MVNSSSSKSIFDLSKEVRRNVPTKLNGAIRMLLLQTKGKKLNCTSKDIAKAFANLKGIIQNFCLETWDSGWNQAYKDVDDTFAGKFVSSTKGVAEFAKDTQGKTPETIVETIRQKREKEAARTKKYRLGIRESAFGRNYVNKRGEYIAEGLQKYYLEELDEALPRYFEIFGRGKSRKDSDLYETLYPLLSPTRIEETDSDTTKTFKRMSNAAAGWKTSRRIERMVITELNAAYNLGRLEAFMSRGIKLVRWNNDAENASSFAPNMQSGQLIRGYMTRYRYFGFPYDPKLHRVCPLCQERAKRETIYGVGIYALEDLLSPTAVMSAPPLHPYCECYLEPIYRREENQIRKKLLKAKVGSEALGIDEQTASNNRKALGRWVIGAATGAGAILSMALMYRMFRRSVTQPPPPPPASPAVEEVITTTGGVIQRILLPPSTPPQPPVQPSSPQAPPQPPSQRPALPELERPPLPLPQLPGQPLEIPQTSVLPELQLTPEQNQILEETLQTETYQSTGQPIGSRIDDEVAASRQAVSEFARISPNISVPRGAGVAPGATWEQVLTGIQNRIAQYRDFGIDGGDTTASQRRALIRQYRQDINLINREISRIDNNTSELYVRLQRLTRIKAEAQAALERALLAADGTIDPRRVDTEALVNKTNKLSELTDQQREVERSLRQTIALHARDGFKSQLVDLRRQLRENPYIQEMYIQEQAPKINAAFERLPNDGRISILEANSAELNRLVNRSFREGLTYEQYRRLSNVAENLEDRLIEITRTTRLPDIDVEADLIATLRPGYAQQDIVLKAQSIRDNKNVLDEIRNRITTINYRLEEEKSRLAREFTTARGGVTKAARLQELQRQRRALNNAQRFEEAAAVEEQIEQILRAEFKNKLGQQAEFTRSSDNSSSRRIISFRR